MRTIVTVLILALTLTACQQQSKIAFLDNTKVVNEFKKKKNFEAKFKTKIEKFNKKSDSLQKAIQMEAQLFQQRASKMSQSKAEEEYNALLQKKQLQDYTLGNEEQALQEEGQQQIDTLVKEVKAFIKDYGETNGYDFILGANDAGSVLYGEASKDLTEEILEALNKENNEEE